MRFVSTYKKPRRLKLQDVLDKRVDLERYFRDKPVDLVFVHGSLAKDAMRALSDVDIAVQFQGNDFTYRDVSEIVDELSEVLQRDDIDLAVMNRASPLLCMQVLSNGRLLYERNEDVHRSFRLRTIQRYLAAKHLTTMFHRYMRHAIMRKGQ